MKTLKLTGLETYGCSKLPAILKHGEEVTVEDDFAEYLLQSHINPSAGEGTEDEVEAYFTEVTGKKAAKQEVVQEEAESTEDAEDEAPTESPDITVAEVAPKATQRVPRGKK